MSKKINYRHPKIVLKEFDLLFKILSFGWDKCRENKYNKSLC